MGKIFEKAVVAVEGLERNGHFMIIIFRSLS